MGVWRHLHRRPLVGGAEGWSLGVGPRSGKGLGAGGPLAEGLCAEPRGVKERMPGCELRGQGLMAWLCGTGLGPKADAVGQSTTSMSISRL